MITDSEIREVIYRALKHFDKLPVSEINVIVVSPQEWVQLGHPVQASAVTFVGSNPPTIILRDDYPHPRGPVAVILHEISAMLWTDRPWLYIRPYGFGRENVIIPWIMRAEGWV